jgi:hypothetical protein
MAAIYLTIPDLLVIFTTPVVHLTITLTISIPNPSHFIHEIIHLVTLHYIYLTMHVILHICFIRLLMSTLCLFHPRSYYAFQPV